MCDQCKTDNLPMDAHDAMKLANDIAGNARIDKDKPATVDNLDWSGLSDERRAIATLGLLVADTEMRLDMAASLMGMALAGGQEDTGASLSFGPDGVTGRMSLN